uniref:Uncharacterized protein n=1 Tax=viral metagenome TaxID=1070528 RepID=A0A6M3J0L0_9ZZZZ
MAKIYPEGVEAVADSSPLEISAQKRAAMVKKAKELVPEEGIEPSELAYALEQYYVFECGEHYTSAQLKDIVSQVETDLKPVVAEVAEL